MKIKILVGLMFFSLLVPSITLAAPADLLPAYNTLCWKQKACEDARAKFNPDKGDSGWLQEKPCTGEWGKCLPTGKTITEVAFGGKKNFSSIGDFLKTNYDIALTIAGILAVIMIIVAGVQWVASGGNSEMISSAKKRIGGALTGLMIAYLSFTILNTINPSMVNLRLPQSFMIRSEILGTEFCNMMPPESKYHAAADADKEVNKDDYAKINSFDIIRDEKKNTKFAEDFKCGKKLFFEGGSGQTCLGQVCPSFQVCKDTGNKKYSCQYGILYGNIGGSLAITGIPVVGNGDNVKLMMMCNTGAVFELADIDVDGKTFLFGAGISTSESKIQILNNIDNIISTYKNNIPGVTGEYSNCAGSSTKKPKNDQDRKQEIVGFYLGVEVNDETGFTGSYVEGAPWSGGVDDWHAVGKNSDGVCNINLSKWLLEQGGVTKCDAPGSTQCSCSGLIMPGKVRESLFSIIKPSSPKRAALIEHLISYDEIFGDETKGGKGGYKCDINITRPDFPSIENKVLGDDVTRCFEDNSKKL